MVEIVQPDGKDLTGTLDGSIELTDLKWLIWGRGTVTGPLEESMPIRVEVIDSVAKGPPGRVFDIDAEVALGDDRATKARCDTHENSFVLSVVSAGRAHRSLVRRGRRV